MKQPETCLIVQLGYKQLVLEKSKAYKMHALLEGVFVLDYKYINNKARHYTTKLESDTSLTYQPDGLVNLTSLTAAEVNSFWNHQEARGKLMGDAFFVQSIEEWRSDAEKE